MRQRNHYSKLSRTTDYPNIICKFEGRRGYHQLSDILKKPYYGKVEVVDREQNTRLGSFSYLELKRKYI